mmetsp:Transcript_16841/g.21961  ORF Transcript_16841/g.21961 Transcript_16841/m.21961 type:complete len:320 (-) Transcript_16841:975-1934(-)
MRGEDGNLFNPVIPVTRFKVFLLETSTLSLVLAQGNHSVRGTLGVDHKLVHVIGCVICLDRSVDSGHEFVFRAEWNFCNHRGTLFNGGHINITKISSTENGKFSWVTNFALATTIFPQRALGTEDTTNQGLTQESRIWAFTTTWHSTTSREFCVRSRDIFRGRSSRSGFFVSRVHRLGDTKSKTALLSTLGTSLRRRSLLDHITGLEIFTVISTGAQVCLIHNKVVGCTLGGMNVKHESLARSDKSSQGHFILCQSTCLVRANSGYTTQSFNGRKGTDDSILLGHVRHSPSICHGDDSFQTLRDHGNSTDESSSKSINS